MDFTVVRGIIIGDDSVVPEDGGHYELLVDVPPAKEGERAERKATVRPAPKVLRPSTRPRRAS